MHDRSNDLGAILAIALGTLLAVPFYGARFASDGFEVVIERSDRGRRFERRYGRERRVEPRDCAAPFRIDSRGPGGSVAGEYAGLARLTPEGLEIQLPYGATSAQLANAHVRGVVLLLTQESGEGKWFVAHRAEPIPIGALRKGETRELGNRRVLIPGVGPTELASGWLVVEHVLDATELDGGTAWTYAHAPRTALAPLLQDRCSFR
jgi:hypothetical protein